MKKYALFLLLLLSQILTLKSQNCFKAAWVKDFGGNSSYQGVVDGDRRPDGQFVIAGSFTTAPLTLGSIVLPNLYAYNYYLAIHDSAGNFSAGAVIASGGTISKIDVGVDGSVYVTGYWSGSIIVGTDTLPNASRNRVFVAKFGADLSFKWLRKSDWMSADCMAYDVTSDLEKNVYICGTFEDDAFKIGDFVVENAGGYMMWSNDAFLIKFDSTGATQYLKSFGGVNDEVARTITADNFGNVFITGASAKTTTGLIRFGDLALQGGVADNNGFIAKINGSTGDFLWAKLLAGLNTYDLLFPYDACLGDDNSLIVCGSITGTVTLPPFTYVASDQNAFVARFSNDGENLWLQQTGGQNSSEYGYYCFSHLGKIAISGRLFSNQTYCAGFPLSSVMTGSFSAFNAMLNNDGSLIWARANYATSSAFYPEVVFIDDAGCQLYWGAYTGTQTWYPVTKTNSSSNHKTFLARFGPYSPAPAFTVSAGPDKTTTCGVNVQLQASTTPSNIPFGWYPSLGFSGNGSKTPNVAPAMPTRYVFYASYQGCVLTDTVFVDVTNYNNFTINAGPDKDICAGDSVQLNVTSNQTGLTYSWLPIKYINTATSQDPWVKPVFSSNYVVTASWGNCKATDTVFVNQHWKPFINLPKQDQYYAWWRYHICEGNPVDVNLGDPSNTYTVLTPSLTSSINNNLVTLHGNSPGGILMVEATSPIGCYSKDSVNIVIHNNQNAPVILGNVPDRTACPGDSIRMVVWLTNSNQYNFQYSWYCVWQVDSMNGQGWKDISFWDKVYQTSIYSSGYPTSTYYARLDIPVISQGMNGFRFRCYLKDYCSPAGYSNAGTLNIGPKLTAQPPVLKTLCQNVTDSISVNSSSANVNYQWEILQGGSWVPLSAQPGVMVPNGRYLRFQNVQPSLNNTLVRCRLSGCNSMNPIYCDSCLIRVVPFPAVISQTVYDTICPGQPDSLMVTPNSNLFSFLWYANNVALTGNTSQISGYNTPKLKFTPVYTAQTNVNYKLKMTSSQCGFSAYSDTTGFHVIPVPAVSWPGNMIFTCVNATPIVLTGATPAGGTYSGPGVANGIFDPSQAGVGPQILTYTVNSAVPGCSASAGKSVQVYDLPVVTWGGGTVQLCTTSSSYHLTGGTPANGTYSGPGVLGAWFNPATSGAGTFTLTYSYTYPTTGCTNSSPRTFIVGASPTVTWPGGNVSLCVSSGNYSLTGGLPAGGTYSGTGVSGNTFNPAISGTGTFTLTYTYTDITGNCSGTATKSFTVTADPVASWPGNQLNYCLDDPAVTLTGGLPTGGVYSGPGVTGNTFSPSIAGPGLHALTYTYTNTANNCSDQVSRNFFVDPCTGVQSHEAGEINLRVIEGSYWIEFPEKTRDNFSLVIYNALGQCLYTTNLPAGITSWQLPKKPEGNGMVLIRLISGSVVHTIKVPEVW